MKALIVLLVLLTSGCAICREHPKVCAVAEGIVIGSALATIAANINNHQGRAPAATCAQIAHHNGGIVGSCVNLPRPELQGNP